MDLFKILAAAKKILTVTGQIIDYVEKNQDVIDTVVNYVKMTGKNLKNLINEEEVASVDEPELLRKEPEAVPETIQEIPSPIPKFEPGKKARTKKNDVGENA